MQTSEFLCLEFFPFHKFLVFLANKGQPYEFNDVAKETKLYEAMVIAASQGSGTYTD